MVDHYLVQVLYVKYSLRVVELQILHKVQPTPVHIVGPHPKSSGLSYYSALSVLMFCMGGLQCELQYIPIHKGLQLASKLNTLLTF